MATTVAQHAHATITDPAASSALSSATVRTTLNALRSTYNDHDADTGIHLQSSVAASRPAAGTAGRKWWDSDTLRLYLDSGSAWGEAAYLVAGGSTTTTASTTIAAGTTTNALIVTTTGAINTSLRHDASNRLDVSVSSAGAVTYNATGASAGHTFSDPVTCASTLSVTGTLELGNAAVGFTNEGVATRFNLRLNSATFLQFNSGGYGASSEVIVITQTGAAPSINPSSAGLLYVESGALKYRGSSGSVTTIAVA